jgi:hypothetical protein
MVNLDWRIWLPHRHLSIHRMVLHESMVAHELDRAIALVGMVIRWIPTPIPDGRRRVDQDSMRSAKVY